MLQAAGGRFTSLRRAAGRFVSTKVIFMSLLFWAVLAVAVAFLARLLGPGALAIVSYIREGK